MTQLQNRPQSWRPTATERDAWVRDALRAVTGLIAGPGGFALYLLGEYVYDRRHLLYQLGGEPYQALNTQGRSAPAGTGTFNAMGFVAGAGYGRTLSITPALTTSAQAMGMRAGDPVSVALAGQTSGSGLVVPGRIGSTLHVTVPAETYSVAALGASRSGLFQQRDPVIGTAGAQTGGGPVLLPLLGRAPHPATPFQTRLPRCPWCGKEVRGSVFAAMQQCPARLLPQVGQGHRARPAATVCGDCGRTVVNGSGHTWFCRVLSFLDDL
ncbi:hypothetical protein [Acrocarpospora catenulata]|uniref:hypothetical protein n=1 Tax=Acrocarpospora catenulata TaxID=2836182 RepID=UPI001BD9D8A8|nr:hypothetical protein [Acrocarpospora catenulata]